MAEARQRDGWNHTAAVLAMLANVNRDPRKGRAFKPADFHPVATARRTESAPTLKGDIGMLKKVFVERSS